MCRRIITDKSFYWGGYHFLFEDSCIFILSRVLTHWPRFLRGYNIFLLHSHRVLRAILGQLGIDYTKICSPRIGFYLRFSTGDLAFAGYRSWFRINAIPVTYESLNLTLRNCFCVNTHLLKPPFDLEYPIFQNLEFFSVT